MKKLTALFLILTLLPALLAILDRFLLPAKRAAPPR